MKMINVNLRLDNVLLQFDSIDEVEITEKGIQEHIEVINNVLESHFPFGHPRLVFNLDSKITVINPSEGLHVVENIIDPAKKFHFTTDNAFIEWTQFVFSENEDGNDSDLMIPITVLESKDYINTYCDNLKLKK